MTHTLKCILSISAVLLLPAMLFAQEDRIGGQIDRGRIVALKGNVHPSARPQFDEGPIDPSGKMTLITLMLKPSDSRQTELEQLLVDQQDPFSPTYHQWLTPEEYADRFGASPNDTAKILSWLQSEGFQVDDIGRGRSWIVFSGTAGQVKTAFHTELHRYRVDGEGHFANATDPSVPAALEPLVRGFLGLDDFYPKPSGRVTPKFTSSGGVHYLAPDDLATIYDLVPLYNAGFDGTGQIIVIAGQTAVDVLDIRLFRRQYNLSPNDPQFVLVAGSSDPGITSDLGEADLDLETSGAVARNATIIYVYSTNVASSVLYAISQNLAPVISYSYGLCEPRTSSGFSANLQAAAQQANAQGITWVASSGDSGAAGCDPHFRPNNAQATQGQYPSFPATIPEVTGVGGTQFNEGGGRYWAPTNSANGGSALSYIPEIAWNESSAQGLASSGGGLSIFYAKPSWQTVPGVPSQNQRASPDVSLTAATHDGYLTFTTFGGQPHQGVVSFGTSAAAPAFAGILGLLNQYQVAKKFQSKAGLGNINPNLYRLYQSASNSFHDIISGNNVVPCVANTLNCVGGSLGFSAGPGYDLVTGLGSVDGNNLVTQWNNKLVNTTTNVTANPASIGLNGSTQVTAAVSAAGSSSIPSGTVAFNVNGTALGSATLGGSGSATITVFGSQLTIGNDIITASYSGSSSFNGSSGAAAVTVSLPTSNSAVIPSATPNPVFQQQTDADGYSWFFTVRLTEVAGVGTTLTGFTFNGVSYATQIANFFGSSAVPARGTLSAVLRVNGLTVPTIVVFGFSGVDPGGHQWAQQLSVPFYGIQTTASLALTSVPGTVRQNTNAAQDCQWLQHLGLQEQNGHSVQLTKFLAGGFDLSSRIQEFFGSTTVPALGSLLSGLCWSGVSGLPQTKTYEIDGTDDTGTDVVATLSAVFDGPTPSTGSLSTLPGSLALSVPGPSLARSTTIGVNVASGTQWTVSVFPSNRTTRWLSVSPQSGSGAATLNILADSTGLANGFYMATLVFQAIDALPQFIDVPVTFTVGTTSPPALNNSGVVSAASFAGNGAAVTPGSLVAIFGSRLNTAVALPPGVPLPTILNGVSVAFNGFRAPLVFISPTQINAQIPYEVKGPTATVAVTNSAGVSNTITVNIAAAAPGLLSQSQNGTGAGAIVNVGTGGFVTPSAPIARGKLVSLYGTGIGPVNPQPASGVPASASPLSSSTNTVIVSIGGVMVTPAFSGLAPGFVGLHQINVIVPANAPTGSAVPVTVTASGVTSNVVTMAIQ